MFFPNIFGAYDTRDLPNLTVAQVPGGEAAIMADIRVWADYHNRVANLYMDLLAESGTEATGSQGNGAGGGELQPYQEYGETEATRTDESAYQWGLPIRRFRDRQMYSEEYVFTESLDRINKDTIAATNRDLTTRIKIVLRALLGNTNYTFVDGVFPGEQRGPIFVKRLFNNDASPGSMFVNGVALALGTLQSYLPSGSATLVVGQFQLARTKLRQRGLTGRIIHVASAADADTIRAMPGFFATPVANPYVNVTGPTATPVTTAVVTRPQSIGVFSDGGNADGEVVIVPFWPSLYTYSFDATQPKPVRFREHSDARFRGFNLVQDQTRAAYGEDALRNKRWERIIGAGVVTRENGVIVQATTGAYTVPAV
jgi:hypothetical protein